MGQVLIILKGFEFYRVYSLNTKFNYKSTTNSSSKILNLGSKLCSSKWFIGMNRKQKRYEKVKNKHVQKYENV